MTDPTLFDNSQPRPPRRRGVKPDMPGDDWSWDRTLEAMTEGSRRKADK